MSLQTTDLFYVQRGAQGHKMPASELVDFIAAAEGTINYRGTVRCDEAPFTGANAGMDPNPAVSGDIYVNTVDATVVGGWTGIVGEEIQNGQRVLFDGTNWAIVGAEAGGGVITIQGVDPIEVDDTDEANPVISVKDAAVGQKGVVVMATDDEPLPSDPDNAVLNKTHYEDLDAKLSAAVAGGVTSVEEGDGIAVDSTDPNHPEVSIDISGLTSLP